MKMRLKQLKQIFFIIIVIIRVNVRYRLIYLYKFCESIKTGDERLKII